MQQQPEAAAQLRQSTGRPPASVSPTELGVASLAQELEVREGILGLVVLDTDHSARPLRPEPAESPETPRLGLGSFQFLAEAATSSGVYARGPGLWGQLDLETEARRQLPVNLSSTPQTGPGGASIERGEAACECCYYQSCNSNCPGLVTARHTGQL